uniref:Putative secreted protein n=1 Tax=Panstrongylus lignarius TaxID=156445 RepID=A0A224XZ21_9HEMI
MPKTSSISSNSLAFCSALKRSSVIFLLFLTQTEADSSSSLTWPRVATVDNFFSISRFAFFSANLSRSFSVSFLSPKFSAGLCTNSSEPLVMTVPPCLEAFSVCEEGAALGIAKGFKPNFARSAFVCSIERLLSEEADMVGGGGAGGFSGEDIFGGGGTFGAGGGDTSFLEILGAGGGTYTTSSSD